MDYRELLVKYLVHVIDYEGTDFLDAGVGSTKVEFTEQELDELLILAKEAQDELKPPVMGLYSGG